MHRQKYSRFDIYIAANVAETLFYANTSHLMYSTLFPFHYWIKEYKHITDLFSILS